jgi:hypothetical protein
MVQIARTITEQEVKLDVSDMVHVPSLLRIYLQPVFKRESEFIDNKRVSVA